MSRVLAIEEEKDEYIYQKLKKKREIMKVYHQKCFQKQIQTT